jgi:hypothetical protein
MAIAQDGKAARDMQDRMYVVQRRIEERHTEANQERLAKIVRHETGGTRGWSPLRVLRLRRAEAARA